MSINSNNNGSNKREEAAGKKSQTPVEKIVSDTKKKVHNTQNGK